MGKQIRQALIDKLALAVAGGASVRAAGRACGIAARTAADLAGRPEFRVTVQKIRDAVMNQAIGKLTASAVKASDTLTDLLGETDPAARHKAAVAILTHAVAVRAATEMCDRLSEIEKRLATTPAGGQP